jgi:hypothetical protein
MNLVILFCRILKRAAYQGTRVQQPGIIAKDVDGETGGWQGGNGVAYSCRGTEQKGKMSALEGVDGLHVGLEKKFNKGNSLVEGEVETKG